MSLSAKGVRRDENIFARRASKFAPDSRLLA
jgi:hypothetical protein